MSFSSPFLQTPLLFASVSVRLILQVIYFHDIQTGSKTIPPQDLNFTTEPTHTHTQSYAEQSLTGCFSLHGSSPVPQPMSCLVLFNIATAKVRCERRIVDWTDGDGSEKGSSWALRSTWYFPVPPPLIARGMQENRRRVEWESSWWVKRPRHLCEK